MRMVMFFMVVTAGRRRGGSHVQSGIFCTTASTGIEWTPTWRRGAVRTIETARGSKSIVW